MFRRLDAILLVVPGRTTEAQQGNEMSKNLPIVTGNGGEDPGAGTTVITERKVQAKPPHLYRVLLHNDDYTPMEFVVMVLETFFNKDRSVATEIMLSVHTKGVGVCGVFPYEIAETKVALVMECARENEHPLQCTMERA
jgi:ATP-dependent Clp protease adaptor protein ClpS